MFFIIVVRKNPYKSMNREHCVIGLFMKTLSGNLCQYIPQTVAGLAFADRVAQTLKDFFLKKVFVLFTAIQWHLFVYTLTHTGNLEDCL